MPGRCGPAGRARHAKGPCQRLNPTAGLTWSTYLKRWTTLQLLWVPGGERCRALSGRCGTEPGGAGHRAEASSDAGGLPHLLALVELCRLQDTVGSHVTLVLESGRTLLPLPKALFSSAARSGQPSHAGAGVWPIPCCCSLDVCERMPLCEAASLWCGCLAPLSTAETPVATSRTQWAVESRWCWSMATLCG